MSRLASLLASLALAAPWAAPARAQDPTFERRWIYVMTNLQVDENVGRLEELIARAKAAGYNGIVLADYKLSVLDRVADWYPRNVARVRKAADAAGVEIIPTIFSIGYSSGILAHDPNLAEGLPAETVLEIRDGVGRPVAGPPGLANGGLEEVRDNGSFAGFTFQDDPGRATAADREVAHGGSVSCRLADTNTTSSTGNARLVQSAKVKPRTCYRLSAWVKTDKLERPGGFRLLAIEGKQNGRSLTFHEGGIEPTQDWKRVSVVFNSLDNEQVNLYAGLWGGSPGTLWIDDLALEEVAFMNILRRDGCPLAVTSSDGRTTYREGRDFEPLVDPKLGQIPYAGEYSFDHEGPAFRVAKGSRIKDGATVLVRWYHPAATHGSQVMCCFSEPKLKAILADQARRVQALLHPRTVFFSHDEIRVANWCKACSDRKRTPGQLLAANVRDCLAIAKAEMPQARVVIWSDMFDPNHNAVDGYYLVNGTWASSWEGLPKSVVIANWNGGKLAESLRFFADRGHEQILAGYYDVDDMSGLTPWVEAARGIPGVNGFMYTTWQAKFDLLEKYGEALRGRAGGGAR